MSSFRFEKKEIDLQRYQFQYPAGYKQTVGLGSNYKPFSDLFVVGDGPFEMTYLDVSLLNSDQETFSFPRPFSGIPNVIAGFASLVDNVGSAIVHVESVTQTGGVIKTSAPVTGKVIVHAIYNS